MSADFKKRTSIFTKLFFVMGLAGLLITVIIGAGQVFMPRPEFSSRTNAIMEKFAHYAITDLGAPPTFANGTKFAEEYGVGVRIEGKGWTWSSSDELPALDSLPDVSPPPGPPPGSDLFRWMPFFLHPLARLIGEGPGRHGPGRHMPFIKFEHQFADGPAKVLFVGPRRPFVEPSMAIMWVQLAGIFLVIFLCYCLVRWVLRPLNSLNDGVQAISQGKLDYRVPVKSSDELGYLASAFNEMAVRVKGMIESKQQLLIDVSHELRSPLTRAKISLELMEASEPKGQVVHDIIELEQMVSNLLESARNESGHGGLARETVDLVQLTKSVVESYSELGKPVAITEHPTSLTARVDAEAVKSVLRNLIENALKYSPDGKSVSIGLTQQPQRARWEIRDEGVGIPPEELERVFQPFYRVDKSRARKTGGFGLGLSLCKRIVEAHGGTIVLESTPDRGTSAIFALPL